MARPKKDEERNEAKALVGLTRFWIGVGRIDGTNPESDCQ